MRCFKIPYASDLFVMLEKSGEEALLSPNQAVSCLGGGVHVGVARALLGVNISRIRFLLREHW